MRIKQAMHNRRVILALNGLVGRPAWGWAETKQAIVRLVDELPPRAERDWGVFELIYTALELDHADRYQWRAP